MNTPEETLDLMRDEFVRIASRPDATEEIKTLCRRAMMDITMRVPLIQQRDAAERDAKLWERRYNEQTELAVLLAEQRDTFAAKIAEREKQ